jgi:transcriptional regulator with XRE-family HTH domain
MATLKVRELGDYIREQRMSSSISLRQLARLAGVSNPYLSQIERGLRKPSAEILQQIAKALRISAEALYVQAGILEERDADTDVRGAILRDEWVTERQKQVLLEIYDSFRKENNGERQSPPPVAEPAPEPEPEPKPARKRTATTARPVEADVPQ